MVCALAIGLGAMGGAVAQRIPTPLDSLMAAQPPVVDIRYNAFKERVLGILPGGPTGGWVVVTQRVGLGLWLGRFGPTGTAMWDTLLAPATLGMPAHLRDIPPAIFIEPSYGGTPSLVVVCPHRVERTYQMDQHLVRLAVDAETGEVTSRAEIVVPKCRELVSIEWQDGGLRLVTNRQDSLPQMLQWPWNADSLLGIPTSNAPTPLRAAIRMAPNGTANGGSLATTEHVAAHLPVPARVYADGFLFWAGTDPVTATGRYYARALTYNGKRVLRGVFVCQGAQTIAYPLDSLRGPRPPRRRRRRAAAPDSTANAQVAASTPALTAGLPRQWGKSPWVLPHTDTSVVAMRSAIGIGWVLPLHGPVRNLGRVRAVPLYVTGPRFTSRAQLLPAYTLFPEAGTAMGLTGHTAELARALTAWGYHNANRVDRYLTPNTTTTDFIWIHEDVSKGRIRIWVGQ